MRAAAFGQDQSMRREKVVKSLRPIFQSSDLSCARGRDKQKINFVDVSGKRGMQGLKVAT